jgi:hypothetical protein
VNRLLQFFPPVAPVAETPEPAKGFDHLAIATFDRATLLEWSPKHIEDAPAHLKYEQVKFGRKFDVLCVADALRAVREFNRPMLGCQKGPQWAVLGFVDGAYERLKMNCARCLTPFRYATQRIVTAPNFKPIGPLAVPAAPWIDTGDCFGSSRQHDCVEKAVEEAVKYNRKLQPGKITRGCLTLWMVVMAIECEAVNSSAHLECQGSMGSISRLESHRFHIVGENWPMHPETLRLVKGGARNG